MVNQGSEGDESVCRVGGGAWRRQRGRRDAAVVLGCLAVTRNRTF